MRNKTFAVILMMLSYFLCACGKAVTPVEEFQYRKEDGEIVITGYIGSDRKIVIPEEIEGRPVTTIGEDAFYEYDMLEVVLPETLRYIENFAFAECHCLESVSIPNGVERIEDSAFYGCDMLTTVELPDGLKYLGYLSFGECDNLLELEIPDSLEEFNININYGFFGNPVSDNTVLIVKADSKALKLIEQHGEGDVLYRIKKDENSKLEKVYCVSNISTFDSNGRQIKKMEYTYDSYGNILKIQVDRGETNEYWNDEKGIYEYYVDIIDGEIDYEYNYTYDGKNNMLTDDNWYEVKEYSYEYNEKGAVQRKKQKGEQDYTEYYYDTAGKLIQELISLDGSIIRISYSYNMDGKLQEVSKERYSDSEERFTKYGKAKFLYDSEDNLAGFEYRLEDGSIWYEYQFVVDSQGRIIERKKYGQEGELDEYSRYKYDKIGNIKEEINYNADEKIKATVKYTYENIDMSSEDYEDYTKRQIWNWYMSLLEN